jgi:hypothetical protein
LAFIGIPYLHDVPFSRAIGQFENVGSRRQHLPGDFHRIAERDNGFFVPLIRSGTRGEYGPKHHSDQHGAHDNYSSSYGLHDTTLLVWIGWTG